MDFIKELVKALTISNNGSVRQVAGFTNHTRILKIKGIPKDRLQKLISVELSNSCRKNQLWKSKSSKRFPAN